MPTLENNDVLIVNDLVAGYTDEIDIINHLSLKSPRGKITCIIGPNGAGKSTLFKAIFGTLRAKKGSIIFDNEEITSLSHIDRLRKGLVYCPQGQNVFPKMTVQENLEMGAFIRKDTYVRKDIEALYDRFPTLADKRQELVGNMSGGQQQLLEMARALLLNPKLVLLDEPSMGLAPKFRGFIFDEISRINKSGETILMVEQNAKKALSNSDYAYVLERGANKYEGPSQQILNDPKVKRLYLGG